jgi:LysR family glycine cleavage system transcriptional activator
MHVFPMFQNLPPLKSLLAFESAARNLSFTYAANELSLTQGAISYQVKKLETHLGIKLFKRKIRQIELTTEGYSLFETTQQMLHKLQDEIQLITPNKHKNQKILTISVSTFFATRWLSKRLGKFLNQYPDITLRLQHSVNDPEFMLEDVDMAIRWGNGDFPNCHSELLFEMPMRAYCSPKLIKEKTGIKTLSDLKTQTLLKDQASNDYWAEWLDKAGINTIDSSNSPVIVDPNVRIQSAIDGHGILLANPLLQDELDKDELVEVFRNIQLDGLGFYLIYKKQNDHGSAVNLFCEWLLTLVE